MTDTHTTRTAPPTRPLHRSRDERIIAGVAGGLGEHLGVNPWWFRWAFILLAVFGGVGGLLYLLAWVVIPAEDEEEPIVTGWLERLDLSDPGAIFGVALVGIASVVLLSRVIDVSSTLLVAGVLFVVGILLYRGDLRLPRGAVDASASAAASVDVDSQQFVDADRDDAGEPPVPGGTGPAPAAPPPRPPREPRERSVLGRLTIAVGLIVIASMALVDLATNRITIEPVHYLAAAVAVVGTGLLVGAFAGRARWLIIVGVILVPILWLTALIPASWNFNAGDFGYRPVVVAEVLSEYKQGAGVMTIDLTRLTRQELAQVGEIEASLGLGEMRIRLPGDVGVEVRSRVGAGEISGPFRTISGVGLDITRELGPEPVALVLDLKVGAGTITISGSALSFGDALVLEGSN